MVSELPLTIYLSRFDLEVSGDDLVVNPDLMAHEEDVEVVLAGEVQSMTIHHPQPTGRGSGCNGGFGR